ncbi:pancreatic secretory granule membrane major glycoprotein GP2-like [Pseudorasbora parva]|uniref:pancreatic secretory granule membrane major glycoprotein GP2-like n=1 Tax=Pseudorasbora parva TaxID=51549 RepID=UPI00351E7BEE
MTVAFQNISSDPCYNYESLDRPWRANNESGDHICDEHFSWNGWYRLFYNGMDIRMPETNVSLFRCNTLINLWLNGSNPQIEDGVVIREVCGGPYYWDCSYYKTQPIRVKACPGNYYVYELVKQKYRCSGYCTDVSTISQPVSTVSPYIFTGSTITWNYDPCNKYSILDNYWRSTLNYWTVYRSTSMPGHDDTRVEWDGWYRLFINGSSAQMPEWCATYMLCGGYSSLWLGGSHPRLEDGVVTREIYGSRYSQCRRYRSNPIQVKACPGNYYVYKFTRPALAIPAPVYCAVSFITPSVDPCYNYTSLNESWRATDRYNLEKCDYNVDWKGWYRLFYNGLNAQMPESCVNYGMCGTSYPLWLNGSHPQLEDGVVTRQVCASAYGYCCSHTSHSIRVKACPGNYYVYEFVKPVLCGAYCAEASNQSISMSTTTEIISSTESITPTITTTDVRDRCSKLNCSEDERCGKKNGVYGCLCNDDHPRSQNDSFDFSETCESSSGSMSVSRCQLFEAGFPADVLHLNDPRCKGTVRNGRVEFHYDNDQHICGTNLAANGTHFIYDNFILGAPRSGGLISREKILKLSFKCVYPQTQKLSMNVEINSLESIVHKTLPAGEGRYRVRMIPYQDEEFIRPFTGRVDAELDQEMHVEVRVEGVNSRQFALVMDTCWATPENDPDYSLRWDLIRSECPNPDDNTVELLQNGVSTSSRFSFRMFIFTANSTKLYLHCAVHLCLRSSNRCSTDCASGHQQREGRSLDFHDSASISMGPLVWSERSLDIQSPGKVQVSRAPGLCGSVIILMVSLLSAYTALYV